MPHNNKAKNQVFTRSFFAGGGFPSNSLPSQMSIKSNRLNGVSTVDFHITAKCSQACPYCWGPRRFRNPVDTETAERIIARIKELGVRRIVFTGGDPLLRLDAPDLIRFAKEIGLETALSTTGDHLTPEILEDLYPYLDLISLPLDGSTEEINSRTKHPGHFAAVMQALGLLRSYPGIDVKVCTPVTRHNLCDVPAIAQFVEAYSHSTQARVFYNIFQAFPRAMFSVKWEMLIVNDKEFSSLKSRISTKTNIPINFLSHETLDKLYVMVFPDGSMTIPRGADYLNFGSFLEVNDFEHAMNSSQFDSAKHLRHSRGWRKVLAASGQVATSTSISQSIFLQV
ncbi:MAG: radical SAM protein [Chloroflexota bacterium]|nr:MAG: radical SAM protein [Chloroflexota bacterium]